ncbi:MAG: ABC transporter substrate-binding protein [Rhodospirillales bacterium]|nr:ABC transporter substrate-binding protein [Rhodospirillales bacterium]
MKRRTLLTGTAALAAMGPLGTGAAEAAALPANKVLKFIPEGNLQNPDPVWTTTTVARNHALMVWDTLFGLDGKLAPKPQMLESYGASPDGLTWTFKLRPGLLFHDGTKVRAIDAVTSINRWMQRDGYGLRMKSQLVDMKPTGEDTFEIRLNKPFPILPFAFGKDQIFVMPERIAKTSAFEQIKEFIGSGPYRFLVKEWVSGTLAAYAKFDRYVPRKEPPSFTAGAKIAHFDRVEWNIITDPATAAAALEQNSEDWWQTPLVQLLPVLKATKGVKVETLDPFGVIPIIRFNCLIPPFDNMKLRRAFLPAINQKEYVTAAVGSGNGLGRVGVGVFTPGSPLANDAGLSVLTGPRDVSLARKLVKEAGYDGQKIVLLAPTDYPTLNALAEVTNSLLKELGFNVEYQAMDWGTLVARRAIKKPLDQGGWSIFCTTWEGLTFTDPGSFYPIFGTGTHPGWFGWYKSAKMESLRDAWFTAPDLAAQKKVAIAIQKLVWEEVPYIPLGQWFQPIAFRDTISGIIRAPFPIFWNVRKA